MLSLIKERRSIRTFQDREVEPEKINQIIQAALLSPSSKNNHPWKFIVIDDKAILSRLSEAKEQGSKFLAKSSLAIAILADPKQSDVWVEDTSIAAILIILTAQHLGLGSCWVQLRKRHTSTGQDSEEYVKGLLKIPYNLRVLCLVAIGYTGEIKSEKNIPKQKLDDIFLNYYEKKYSSMEQ
jgi:nitroreductase